MGVRESVTSPKANSHMSCERAFQFFNGVLTTFFANYIVLSYHAWHIHLVINS